MAEWWNTWSSGAIIGVSVFGLWLCRRHQYEQRFVVCFALLAIVGIGSALFHGTLHWAGQALDELPMVYTSLAFLYAILQTQSAPPIEVDDRASEFDGVPVQTRLNFEHCLPASLQHPPGAAGAGGAVNGNGASNGHHLAAAAAGWSGDPASSFYGGPYGATSSMWSEDDDMVIHSPFCSLVCLASSLLPAWLLRVCSDGISGKCLHLLWRSLYGMESWKPVALSLSSLGLLLIGCCCGLCG